MLKEVITNLPDDKCKRVAKQHATKWMEHYKGRFNNATSDGDREKYKKKIVVLMKTVSGSELSKDEVGVLKNSSKLARLVAMRLTNKRHSGARLKNRFKRVFPGGFQGFARKASPSSPEKGPEASPET